MLGLTFVTVLVVDWKQVLAYKQLKKILNSSGPTCTLLVAFCYSSYHLSRHSIHYSNSKAQTHLNINLLILHLSMLPLDGVQVPKLAPQTLDALPLHLVHQLCHFRRNNLLVEPKKLVRVLARQRLSKRRHGEARVSVALPPVDGVGLDDDAGGVGTVLQDLALVFERLGVEEALAGKGDDAGLDVVLGGQELARLDGEHHFGADADEGHVRVGLLDEDVRAALGAGAGGELGVLLKVLAGERDDRGRVRGLEGGDKCSRRLFRVARPDVEEVRHGAVQGRQGDGLVGRAVLSGADGVVGGDVDGLEALQGAHAHAGGGVYVEHEEAGRDGEDGALGEGGEAVGDGRHGVFADAPVDVAAGVGAVDAAGCFEGGLKESQSAWLIGWEDSGVDTYVLKVNLVLPNHIH